jgi:hypothetical protein
MAAEKCNYYKGVDMRRGDDRIVPGARNHRPNIVKKETRIFAAFLWMSFGLLPSAASAADSFGFATAAEDVKLYFTAPIRWDEEDWLYFGGALAAIGAAHEFDQKVRTHFATGPNAILNGEDKNSLRDAAPAVALIAGTWAYAAYLDDSDGYREAWSLVEAGVLSTASGEILSYAAGRERPDATTSANQWRQGGDSFPSLHAGAAFAIGTVFAESGSDEYRWIRRIIGYGIAGATAYVRVRENVHWLSDTVAGSALGIATARFVLNRRDSESRASLQFQPLKDGWLISYSMRTN